MPSGWTTSTQLQDSHPKAIQSARIIQEYKRGMLNLVDVQRLGAGVGSTWHEISLSKLTAGGVTETTDLDNYQQIVDTDINATPSKVGLAVLITNTAMERISKNVAPKIGGLGQNAVERKLNADLLAVLDSFTTSFGGAGTTMTFTNITGAVARIESNATEPFRDFPKYAVMHGFQLKDLQDELTSGIGTQIVTAGLSAEAYQRGVRGSIGNAQLVADDNLTIDSSDDAKGGVFAGGGGGAIILVRGKAPWTYDKFEPGKGGGATIFYWYDEYATLVRQDVAGCELYTDAVAPS